MSVPFSGTLKQSAGVMSAIAKQVKSVNLKPVKTIQVQFDPFHSNAVTIRDFLFYISSSKVLNTNLSCGIWTNVVCDRSEPFVKINLLDSKSIKLLCNNLTVLELLQIYNKHVSTLVKEEDTAAVQPIKKSKTKKR